MVSRFGFNGDDTAAPIASEQPTRVASAEPLRREAAQDCEPGKGSICSWHPNKNASTAEQWFNAAKENIQKPIATDQNCDYVVKYGDSLQGIASRRLGTQADAKSIDKEVARIVELNKAAHPTLDCNKDFLRVGWKLKMDVCAEPAPPPPPPRVIERTPPPVYKDLPPQVIERQPPPVYVDREPQVIYRDVPPKIIYRQAEPIVRELPPPAPTYIAPAPRLMGPPMRHDFGCHQGGADVCGRDYRPQFPPYGATQDTYTYGRGPAPQAQQDYTIRDGRLNPRVQQEYYTDPNQTYRRDGRIMRQQEYVTPAPVAPVAPRAYVDPRGQQMQRPAQPGYEVTQTAPRSGPRDVRNDFADPRGPRPPLHPAEQRERRDGNLKPGVVDRYADQPQRQPRAVEQPAQAPRQIERQAPPAQPVVRPVERVAPPVAPRQVEAPPAPVAPRQVEQRPPVAAQPQQRGVIDRYAGSAEEIILRKPQN